IARTPADGLVAGVGDVDGESCVVMSYDYTVLAGTQGMRNHQKKDRLFELAERRRLPVVMFAEGGGGRPGDVDWPIVAGLDCRAFALFARLSGLVPLVGIASGYCFAGNAALLGCCDVVIATEDSSIGMGGPAMIEGGGLGVHAPGDVGPIDMQEANGVVDLRVADDRAATQMAKRYLSYFRRHAEPPEPAAVPDQELLRGLIPANRKRIYDVRTVIDGLFDQDSVLELRRGFGAGIVTSLARLDGRPLGVVANDPSHLGGAIDAHAADKAARFMVLCDAFELPIAFLCDTPGFMVGPDAERTATVRHFARMFVTGANLQVPTGTVVLRKGYGLGAQAMAGGGFKEPLFTVGWPTSEFGAMGLEGAVKWGMRRELEAIDDETERSQAFDGAVAAAYERGQGVNMAAYFEIDDVIDPADTRRWLRMLFDQRTGGWWTRPCKRRPYVDTWGPTAPPVNRTSCTRRAEARHGSPRGPRAALRAGRSRAPAPGRRTRPAARTARTPDDGDDRRPDAHAQSAPDRPPPRRAPPARTRPADPARDRCSPGRWSDPGCGGHSRSPPRSARTAGRPASPRSARGRRPA